MSMTLTDTGHEGDREDPNAVRMRIAQALVERQRAELGPHLLAAAIYGSVAHGAAATHSDVEVALVTDETVPYGDSWYFDGGIMVEYTCVSAERWLAAAQRVTDAWGIEADQNLRHIVLWDPDGFFPRLHERAHTIPDDAFAPALRQDWWWAYEARGKFRNAVAAGDQPRVHYCAWQFAYVSALRIALHERRPYESARTIWEDVRARGYGMPALLDALVTRDAAAITAAMDVVWEATRGWGAPEEPA